MKNNIDIDDNELISLLPEDEAYIKNVIYDKYSYIIDVLLKKYQRFIKKYGIDEEEIRCEASYGFSDGVNSFLDSKNASLKTFLTLCIERRIYNYLDRFGTKKSKIDKDILSLDFVYDDLDAPLIEMVSDTKNEPLKSITQNETTEEIARFALEKLSPFERKVFSYMINDIKYQKIAKDLGKSPKQIDNTIQRIKNKLRKYIEK